MKFRNILCFVLILLFTPTSNHAEEIIFPILSLDESQSLVGKWQFTRDNRPSNKDVGIDTSDWKSIRAPGSWKKAYGDGKNFTDGWYRATFQFDPSLIGTEVVILMQTYASSFWVYLDGEPIYQRPYPEKNISRYYALQPTPIRFTVTQEEHLIVIHINTILMSGIYSLPFEIKKYDPQDSSLAWYSFLGGELRVITTYIVLISGLFFLLIYLKVHSTLYLVAALAQLMSIPFFGFLNDYLIKFFSEEEFHIAFLLHYIGLFTVFFYFLFSQYFYKRFPRLNKVWGTIYGATALSFLYLAFDFDLDLFHTIRSVYFVMTQMSIILAIWVSFMGWRNKKPGAGLLCLGVTFYFMSGINDMLMAIGVRDSLILIPIGATFVAMILWYVTSNIFADTFVENKKLLSDVKLINENLENIVQERTFQLAQKTRDISSILQHLPEGILTILPDRTIHHEYSAYLEVIFNTNQIANKDVMSFVFEHSDLGADTYAQLQSTMETCIGEDQINFELNTHLLVKEVKKRINQVEKHLELSWVPIYSDDGLITKLMLTIRDVTQLRQLQNEAEIQKRELGMISQLLSLSQEKFDDFLSSATDFVQANRELIETMESKDPEILNTLFRNMHTIKGNARTYGLLYMTNQVHETEQEYDHLRKQEDYQLNRAKLIEQLDQTEHLLQEYAKINHKKLGRSRFDNRKKHQNFLLVEKQFIEKTIEQIKNIRGQDNKIIMQYLSKLENAMKLIGTETIDDMLAPIKDSLASLAKELEKPEPTLTIRDNRISIVSSVVKLLKNVFMHTFRNSIDHGIESPEERVLAGKSEAGHIDFSVRLDSDFLYFELQDDGKGLALEKIRQKAIHLHLIKEEEVLAPEAIGELIFHPGFSTSTEVSEVSGRGVGMDAVKEFIEQKGGNVEIVFTDYQENRDFQPFKLLFKLPSAFAVERDANLLQKTE